jgi:hypothetical protein
MPPLESALLVAAKVASLAVGGFGFWWALAHVAH